MAPCSYLPFSRCYIAYSRHLGKDFLQSRPLDWETIEGMVTAWLRTWISWLVLVKICSHCFQC